MANHKMTSTEDIEMQLFVRDAANTASAVATMALPIGATYDDEEVGTQIPSPQQQPDLPPIVCLILTPKERDIILVDGKNIGDDFMERGKEERQQHHHHYYHYHHHKHIGNIRYQHFIDSIIRNSSGRDDKNTKAISNIIDTIYRNGGRFIKPYNYKNEIGIDDDGEKEVNGIDNVNNNRCAARWSTVVDLDIIRIKVLHSLLRSRMNTTSATTAISSSDSDSDNDSSVTTDDCHHHKRSKANENENKSTKVPVSVEGKDSSPITAGNLSRATSTTSTTTKSTIIATNKSTTITTTTKRNSSNSNSNNNSLLDSFELLLSQQRSFKKRRTTIEMNRAFILPRRSWEQQQQQPTLLSSLSSKTMSTAISTVELSDNNNTSTSTSTSISSAPTTKAYQLRIEEDVDSRSDNDDDDDDDNEIDDKEPGEVDDEYKYYEKLSAGCVTYGEKEEMYDDIVFRKSNGWKTRIQRRMKYLKLHHSRSSKRRNSSSSRAGDGDGDGDSRIRILFPSTVDPKDVADVLQYMIEQNFFNDNDENNDNNDHMINHLAFDLVEVVNDYVRDATPMSFPIKIFGDVLKSMNTSTNERNSSSPSLSDDGDNDSNSDSGNSVYYDCDDGEHERDMGTGKGGRYNNCTSGGVLQSLNLKNIRFIGTRNEFTDAFQHLAECDTIREFICESCRFRILGDTSSLRKRKIIRNTTNNTTTTPPPQANACNVQIFNLMFEALNEIDSLEVLSINDVELRQCSNSFNKILLKCNNDNADDTDENKKKTNNMKQQQQQRPQRKKKMKVLAIGDCTVSDRTLEAMFGENSRVEKLCLMDVILSKDQKNQISTLLRRTRNSNSRTCTRTSKNDKNGGRRSCCNLKYLLLRWMDHPYLTVPQTISLMDALEMNDTLKVLHLDVECYKDVLCNMAPAFIDSLKRLNGLQILHLTFNGMSGQKGLDCIKSIVRGFDQNTTIKKVDFLVSGYQDYRQELSDQQKEEFRTNFNKDINSSLLHSLTSKNSRCVLEEFYLYVDGKFPITLNDEIKFWFSMNKNDLKHTLSNNPDDFKLWIDAIIQYRCNPKIVYHLLRQNHALLLLPPRTTTNIETKNNAKQDK